MYILVDQDNYTDIITSLRKTVRQSINQGWHIGYRLYRLSRYIGICLDIGKYWLSVRGKYRLSAKVGINKISVIGFGQISVIGYRLDLADMPSLV